MFEKISAFWSWYWGRVRQDVRHWLRSLEFSWWMNEPLKLLWRLTRLSTRLSSRLLRYAMRHSEKSLAMFFAMLRITKMWRSGADAECRSFSPDVPQLLEELLSS